MPVSNISFLLPATSPGAASTENTHMAILTMMIDHGLFMIAYTVLTVLLLCQKKFKKKTLKALKFRNSVTNGKNVNTGITL